MELISFVRLDKKTATKITILTLTIIIAFTIRMLPSKWGITLTAFDPFFQYRATKYIIEHGFKAWYSWHDTMRWYPTGRTYTHHLSGVPFTGAFLYLLLWTLIGPQFNISVYHFCALLPPIFGAITCLTMYFLAKEIGGETTGLFSAFFLAICGAYIDRTILGFYDTEMVGIFGMILTLLLYIKAIKTKETKKALTYGILAGLSQGYINISWNASRFIPVIIGLSLMIELIRNRLQFKQILIYTLMGVIGTAIWIYMLKLTINKTFFDILLTFSMLGVFLLHEALKIPIKEHKKRVITTLTILGGLIIGLHIMGFTLDTKFMKVIFPTLKMKKGDVFLTVAEHSRPTWLTYFKDFGFMIPLSIFGCIMATKQLNQYEKQLMVILYLFCLYVSGGMIRLKLILSIPMTLMAGYGVVNLIKPFIDIEKRYNKRRYRKMKPLGQAPIIILSLMIVTTTTMTMMGTIKQHYMPTTLVSSGIPILINNEPIEDWMEALVWMHDNLPQDAVVASWWDYGYWITAISERATLADGSTDNYTRIQMLANMFLAENETTSLEILKELKATHIVVFISYDPFKASREGVVKTWGYGEDGKWTAMAHIAQKPINYYLDDRGNWNQHFRNTTLYKLMTTQELKHFKLIFISNYGFIRIYEITERNENE